MSWSAISARLLPRVVRGEGATGRESATGGRVYCAKVSGRDAAYRRGESRQRTLRSLMCDMAATSGGRRRLKGGWGGREDGSAGRRGRQPWERRTNGADGYGRRWEETGRERETGRKGRGRGRWFQDQGSRLRDPSKRPWARGRSAMTKHVRRLEKWATRVLPRVLVQPCSPVVLPKTAAEWPAVAWQDGGVVPAASGLASCSVSLSDAS